MSEKIYRINEAAAKLGISRQALYDWLKKGKITKIVIGGVNFIPEGAILNAKKNK